MDEEKNEIISNLMYKDGLETGIAAYKQGRKHEKQNRIDDAIYKYREAYNCYVENQEYSSYVITRIFTNLCCLYIKKNEYEKLLPLLETRTRDILAHGNKKLDEIIRIYISLGDLTKAYELMVDQYDYMHSVYGTDHNYLSLANLFMQAKDYITSAELLEDTQSFFIKRYGKRSKKVDNLLVVCKKHKT